MPDFTLRHYQKPATPPRACRVPHSFARFAEEWENTQNVEAWCAPPRLESIYQQPAALEELKESLLHQAFTGQL
jgi:hypothetical protein